MGRLLVLLVLLGLTTTAARASGPVALLGVDGEETADDVSAQELIGTYADLVATILSRITNGGSGILVIGGGKDVATPDQVTLFWDTIGVLLDVPITFANGPAAISEEPFDGFAMLAVTSTRVETAYGGLNEDENAALSARQRDVAHFVNAGGGLLGFSQFGLTEPYRYAVGPGAIRLHSETLEFSRIKPTPEGRAVGVDASLSGCCWHAAFDDFPPFLDALATGRAKRRLRKPVAIGGSEVTLPGCGDRGTGAEEECNDESNQPPDCSNVVPTVATIRRANHKFVEIELEGVTDADGDEVTVEIVSLCQDEPVDDIGDGRTCPDASGLATPSARVRAERSGSRRNGGNGRVYHIGFKAVDGRNGACKGEVAVCVPHNGRTCTDDGPNWDSTASCENVSRRCPILPPVTGPGAPD